MVFEFNKEKYQRKAFFKQFEFLLLSEAKEDDGSFKLESDSNNRS